MTYPLPRPDDDLRFTMGLLIDVSAVLTAHGYPRVETGDDLVALQQALFGFLYELRPAPGLISDEDPEYREPPQYFGEMEPQSWPR